MLILEIQTNISANMSKDIKFMIHMEIILYFATGGIITSDDLSQYRVYDKPPVKVHLQNGQYTVYGPPPPSSGAILQYIFNILDGMLNINKIYFLLPIDQRLLIH